MGGDHKDNLWVKSLSVPKLLATVVVSFIGKLCCTAGFFYESVFIFIS